MRINGEKIPLNTLLLSMIADSTTLLVWQNTRDGQTGRNQPQSIMELLTGGNDKDKPIEFDSASDFLEVWNSINGN